MGWGEGRMGRSNLPDGYGNTWGRTSSCHYMAAGGGGGGGPPLSLVSAGLTSFSNLFFSLFLPFSPPTYRVLKVSKVPLVNPESLVLL